MPVGVGIIGTNWGAKTQTPIFRAAGLEVVALYSRRLSKAEEICETMGIEHAFDTVEDLCSCPDVEIVSVTSPTYLHSEHAIAALKAGKHVLCDKPAGASVEEVRAMVECSRDHPGQLSIIDHETRLTPAILAARQAILVDGAIGELLHFDLHQVRPKPRHSQLDFHGRSEIWELRAR